MKRSRSAPGSVVITGAFAGVGRSQAGGNSKTSYAVGRAAASDRERTRMIHRARRAGQGLGGGEADPVGSLDRLAVDTLNKAPLLRSKIVLLQQDEP
jgi:hypothetical protein